MTDAAPQPQVITPHQAMFGAILEVTGWRTPAIPAGRVGKLATALLKSGALADDIRTRFGPFDPGDGWWWRRDTWQGRKGNARPDEKVLREYCGAWLDGVAVQLPHRRTGLDSLLEYARSSDADADA